MILSHFFKGVVLNQECVYDAKNPLKMSSFARSFRKIYTSMGLHAVILNAKAEYGKNCLQKGDSVRVFKGSIKIPSGKFEVDCY